MFKVRHLSQWAKGLWPWPRGRVLTRCHGVGTLGLGEAEGWLSALSEEFLPALFQVDATTVAANRALWALPTKHGGLGIPDPTTTGEALHRCSTAVTEVFSRACWKPVLLQWRLEVYT